MSGTPIAEDFSGIRKALEELENPSPGQRAPSSQAAAADQPPGQSVTVSAFLKELFEFLDAD